MNSYLSRAVLASFDGEGVVVDPAAVAVAAAANVGATGAPSGEASFTPAQQEALNRILADDKRRHQAQLQKVQATLEETLASKNLTIQEREQLATQLEDLRKETRTKEQQLAHEKKQLEEQFTKRTADLEKSAKDWEQRYRDGTIEQALMDAAVKSDAFNVGQFITQLKPLTRLSEIMDEKTGKGTGKFKVVVDFPDTDPNTGEPTVTLHTPTSAAKRMKELSAIYGNLFKSGVVSGVGAATGGLASGSGGKVDPKTLSQEQYMKIRAENPALLGLRPQKGKSGR